MSIEFGVQVPTGWRGELGGIDRREQWSTIVEFVRVVEDLGFDAVWTADHLHAVVDQADEMYECYTTLAALSQVTSRVRLGQLVSCAAYRQPALQAKMLATLDVISNGRLIWGVGAGWFEPEFTAYGYVLRSPRDRVRVLRETIEIVKLMWTQDFASYEGEFFSIDQARCVPKPLQSPHPEILVGAWGEQLGLRVVALHADRCNFPGGVEDFAHRASVLRKHCDAVGRDYADIRKTWAGDLVVRENENEIDHAGRRTTRVELLERARAQGIAGTPEQVASRIRGYAAAGVSSFTFVPSDFPSLESLEIFATAVMPKFR